MSPWHRCMKRQIAEELEAESWKIAKKRNGSYSEKCIGFTWPATNLSMFKCVDILAERSNEVLIIELEDRSSEERGEQGVQYYELGGILLLCDIAAQQVPHRRFTLRLVFRDSIVAHRQEMIENIVDHARERLSHLTVRIEYRK